ncbi:MAG: alcohol dehydrogenase catalytic domain-containing protein [Kosmotoga sp.]|uniref:MDR/zinc-dependent alcohol dehydrogenase-like family protein n=1 Tax=Kosmotoga sp. TaxID=1955248 RepID=UPI001DEB2851|nr:alcohol dehydrogenase catalytic domain-containing protein [Kosmotoga sp.]MBO8167086.1 alcohol dehydrogenase catalytic domain-containing protein [Kosmotoga sp.]
MKALYYDGDSLVLKNVPIPEITKGESLIKVYYTGICNTDLEILKGYMGFTGIPGHEFVGEVVKAPKNKSLVGKRVVGEINIACGQCDLCRAGKRKHCRNIRTLGINNYDGAFAEYMKFPVENLHPVPDEIPNTIATLVEPLAAAFQVLEQAHIKPTDRVCVIGDGKLGLLISIVLQYSGIHHVLIGKHPERTKEVIPEVETLLPSELKGLENSFDVVVEATGNAKGFTSAIDLTAPTGTLVLKSTFASGENLNLSPVVVKELNIVGSRCGPFEPAIAFLKSQHEKLEGMISGIFPFEEYQRAFEATKGSLKILLRMG